MSSPWTTAASISGATAVALGAFGAHGLKTRISDPAKITSWGTAAQYQLVHSVALLAVDQAFPGRQGFYAKSLFAAGIAMFSGSIYALVLDGKTFGKALGPVTPVGGMCLIGGWMALAVASRGRSARV